MSVAVVVIPEFEHLLREAQHRISHCVGQLDEEQIWWRACEGQNSIANLILHISGNLRQWCIAGLSDQQDVRNRDGEFSTDHTQTREQLLDHMAAVVNEALDVLKRLTDEDLTDGSEIQGFPVTGLQALFHTVPHFVGHTHQIVYITRLILGEAYRFDLSLENHNRPGVPL
jgi:uncharacterized damage-inducible protein DinB